MSKRADIEVFARNCIGTPWHHEGRNPGLVLDCVGLIIVTGWGCGLIDQREDERNYNANPDGVSLIAGCERRLGARVAQADLQGGDVVAVRFKDRPQHLGIVGHHPEGGLSFIHACNRHRRVVEHRLQFGRAFSFVAGFSYRGVI